MACAGVARRQRVPADRAGSARAGANLRTLVQAMVLEDGRTLSNCNIQKEHTLYLQISVKTLPCKDITSDVEASDTYVNDKARARKQSLIFASKQLRYDRTLSEYDIQRGESHLGNPMGEFCYKIRRAPSCICRCGGLSIQWLFVLSRLFTLGLSLRILVLAGAGRNSDQQGFGENAGIGFQFDLKLYTWYGFQFDLKLYTWYGMLKLDCSAGPVGNDMQIFGKTLAATTIISEVEVWAFANIGHAAPGPFDAIAEVTPGRLTNFSSQHLVHTVWAFAEAGLASPVFFDAFEEVWAFAKIGHAAQELFNAIAEVNPSRLKNFISQHVSHIAWAIATIGHADTRAAMIHSEGYVHVEMGTQLLLT